MCAEDGGITEPNPAPTGAAVIVLGDINQETAPGSGSGTKPQLERFPIHRDGGVFLLSSVITAATQRINSAKKSASGVNVYSYNLALPPPSPDRRGAVPSHKSPSASEHEQDEKFRERLASCRKWPTLGGSGTKDVVWINETSFDKDQSKRLMEGLLDKLKSDVPKLNRDDRGNPPRVIVIHDRDHGFRNVDLGKSLGPFLPPNSAPGSEASSKRDGKKDVIVLDMELRATGVGEIRARAPGLIRSGPRFASITPTKRLPWSAWLPSARPGSIFATMSPSSDCMRTSCRTWKPPRIIPLRSSTNCLAAHVVLWYPVGVTHIVSKNASDLNSDYIYDYYCPNADKGPGFGTDDSLAECKTLLVAAIVRGIAEALDAGQEGLSGTGQGIRLGVCLAAQSYLSKNESTRNGYFDKAEKEIGDARHRYDLQLEFSEDGTTESSTLTMGKGRIALKLLDNVLQIRIHVADDDGEVVTDETQLEKHKQVVEQLKTLLNDVRSRRKLSDGERSRVIKAVLSIVGITPRDVHPFVRLFQLYDHEFAETDEKREDLYLSRMSIPKKAELLRGKKWCRVNWLLDEKKKAGMSAEKVAIAIVQRGLKKVVEDTKASVSGLHPPLFPIPRVSCAFPQFGKIETIDRDEIDDFLSITSLFRQYLRNAKWENPLSIAVFGPPGSGKSFTVKQLLEKVAPGHGESSLEFNVAQFTRITDLATACHLAQDRACPQRSPW